MPALFAAAIERALKYHIDNIQSFNNICAQLMKQNLNISLEADIDSEYFQRDEYKKGCFSQEQDSKVYQDLMENTQNKEEYFNE